MCVPHGGAHPARHACGGRGRAGRGRSDGQRVGLTQRGGLLVVGVEEGSPAGRGGLIIGDILATLDGQPVDDTEDLLVLLTGDRVGREVEVGVIRGGELRTLRVTVGERG